MQKRGRGVVKRAQLSGHVLETHRLQQTATKKTQFTKQPVPKNQNLTHSTILENNIFHLNVETNLAEGHTPHESHLG